MRSTMLTSEHHFRNMPTPFSLTLPLDFTHIAASIMPTNHYFAWLLRSINWKSTVTNYQLSMTHFCCLRRPTVFIFIFMANEKFKIEILMQTKLRSQLSCLFFVCFPFVFYRFLCRKRYFWSNLSSMKSNWDSRNKSADNISCVA